MMKQSLLTLLLIITLGITSQAWVYPEHREFSLLAVRKLDPDRRARLDQLWSQARKGYESRLTESVADFTQGEHPPKLDWAAWAAIGGDHSTSPTNMLHNVLETEWILKVADIAARLKTGLETADNTSEHLNRLRDSDIRLLRADPEYVSRAGGNYGHFMLARPEVNTTAKNYFEICYSEGCALNLVGNYKWFHASALMKAQRLADTNLSPEQRSALALAALADEAFALHFLNDGFAAGHVAGIWGDASQRKGTHDYYNEIGLDISTWKGERVVIMGDAYMLPEDADRASNSVLLSLNQFLDAASGKLELALISDLSSVITADTFNVGKAMYMPARDLDTSFNVLFYPVLETLPIAGLATGRGELPRFRSEIGPFIGLAASARGSVISSGFESSQNTSGFVPGLGLSIRFGLGMEGVLNESGDGLAFLDLGWQLDGASSMKYYNEPLLKYYGAMLSAIPSRDAYFARLRLPFCLIPGDLVVAAPFLLIFAPETLNKMIVAAGNGGLVPWQTGMVTPIGRFQFVIGREIGVAIYGVDKAGDAMLVPDDKEDADKVALMSFYSAQLDFPIFEYRPFRTFSARQSADLVIQIIGGIDIPFKSTLVYKDPDNNNDPELKTTWFVSLRMAFDWRYYFSGKKQKQNNKS
jgi:hypothetical protein